MTTAEIALTAGFAAGGAAVAWAYLAILRYSLRFLGGGGAKTVRFVALALLRVGVLTAGLLGALYSGTWPLVGYMAGFIIARMAILWGERRRAGAAFDGKGQMTFMENRDG